MKDKTEKPVESEVTETPATPATPAIEKNAEKPFKEIISQPGGKIKKIPATEKPNEATELRSELKQMRSLIAEQNAKNAAILKQLNDNVKSFYKDLVPFLNDLGQNVVALVTKVSDVEKEQSDTIEKQQDSLKELLGTINKLQDCVTLYQSDVLFKAQKEILEDMVQLSDQVRCSVLEQERSKDYESLLDSMKQIGKWVDASLERSKMRKFEDCADGNPAIDKKRQEVVELAETEIAEKDGCFVTRQPGYLWTIPFVGSVETMLSGNAPQKFEFVFRPEQVAKLKYKSKKKK